MGTIVDYCQYETKKEKVLGKYGAVHLCGNCKHMMTCERMNVQNVPHIHKKEGLMKKNAPFVKRFVVEEMNTLQTDFGFIMVFECDNFEYEKF